MPPRTLDQLGDEIAELSVHLEAATARLLDLIREFDTRAGWNTGFRSCAHWLAWRAGLDVGAARERVRVARALEKLPKLAQALAHAELSYAKVRAMTRVASTTSLSGRPSYRPSSVPPRGTRPRASCPACGSASTIIATFFSRLRKRAGMRSHAILSSRRHFSGGIRTN